MDPVQADLLLVNGRIVDVFSGEVFASSLAVKDGRILGFGEYPARCVEDLGGKYLAPGFIDAHVHIESSMASVSEFVRTVLPRGVTTVVADPHEIANVCGLEGIRYMLAAAEGQPANVYFTLPSCVPSSPLETSGAVLSAEDLKALAGHPRMLGLGEMMNFPGVVMKDPGVHAKLALMKALGKPLDGHAPGLSGASLNTYLAAGIGSDHECASLSEAKEKLQSGMRIMIREGTGAKNLAALLPLVNEKNSRRFMWCTDDRHPGDLLGEGSIDDLVRRGIEGGLDPVTAIQMATLNPAEYFGLSHLGGIAPGRRADLVVFGDLACPEMEAVYCAGQRVAGGGKVLPGTLFPQAAPLPGAVHLPAGTIDFSIPAESDLVRVIRLLPGQLITREEILPAKISRGMAVSDPARDVLKIAVVERHGKTGAVGKGFVTGLGLSRGAIAASVAHDSHNIILAGANDGDMEAALRRVAAMGGGLAVVSDGEILAELPLPIAGLMSPAPMGEIRDRLRVLTDACKLLGSGLPDPFMALSFLALPVIPDLKITDLGLIDVKAFRPVSLFLS